MERERDRLINEVNQLNTKLANALSYQEELERKTSATDLKVNEYAALLEVFVPNIYFVLLIIFKITYHNTMKQY